MKKRGKPKLKIRKFYNVRDGSKTGHPGRIFNINYETGEYDSIITGTTYNDGYIPINPTDSIVKKSFMKPNPFRGTRSDYGDKEYSDMTFDQEALIKSEKIKKKPYKYGSHYKKKHGIK